MKIYDQGSMIVYHTGRRFYNQTSDSNLPLVRIYQGEKGPLATPKKEKPIFWYFSRFWFETGFRLQKQPGFSQFVFFLAFSQKSICCACW